MQRVIYLVFISIFFIDKLGAEKLIPRTATYLPEILSIALLLTVLYLGARRKIIDLHVAYWLIFLLIGMTMLCSIILNQVAATTQVVGARTYLKYIPFFFLPAVYFFSREDIHKQLLFLCMLTVMQLPIALYQRLVLSANTISGDRVNGTLVISSHLSIYLICAGSVLLAFYYKGLISKKYFYLLLVLFLAPTMINETKGTLFLLPIGLMLPSLFQQRVGEKVKSIMIMGIIGVIFIAVYIPVYDYFRSGETPTGAERRGIVEYFSEGHAERYLARQTLSGDEEEKRGRFDLIAIAVTELSDDFTKLMLGVGIGNISPSFLGEDFNGEYLEEYGQQYIAVSQLIWEIGLFGTGLLFLLWLKLARDASYVSRRNDQVGALALGWIGVIGVLFISLAYKNLINVNMGYLFWFYSGYIASERMRLIREAHSRPQRQ